MGICEEIRKHLFELQDLSYKDFQAKLMPTISKDLVIGVRTPLLRTYAKELKKNPEIEQFLNDLPHTYYEENNLHSFLIEQEKDYSKCIEKVKIFLPYIDNWATCDSMSPKVFKKEKEALLEEVYQWIESKDTYTIRFGIEMLMSHFLDDDYKEIYPEMVSKIRSEEYYVNMMIAWYFATALAKQYESILPFLEEKKLDVWTHNKTIQKACESYRITKEQKQYLKTLKIKA